MYCPLFSREQKISIWKRFLQGLKWEIGEPKNIELPHEFCIRGELSDTLVRVLPEESHEHFKALTQEFIRQSGECGEISPEVLLVLPTGPLFDFTQMISDSRHALGFLCEVNQQRPAKEGWWQTACFGKWEKGQGSWGFCPELGHYIDRISGGYDGGRFGRIRPTDTEWDFLLQGWIIAECIEDDPEGYQEFLHSWRDLLYDDEEA